MQLIMEDQINDIENYLVNFQKEITDDGNNLNTSTMLYTSNNILSNGESIYNVVDKTVESDCASKENAELEGDNANDKGSAKCDGVSQEQQSNSKYQAVTLVPSEIDENGEVRYMLIPINIQPDGAADSEQKQMSVFDFEDETGESVKNASGAKDKSDKLVNGKDKKLDTEEDDDEKEDEMADDEVEGDEEGVDDEDEDEDDKLKEDYELKVESIEEGELLKCNYCNFSSTKRFRLARHLR